MIEFSHSEVPKSELEFLEVVEEKTGTVNLAEADIIVSGGRGLKEAKNVASIEKLALAAGAPRGRPAPPSTQGSVARRRPKKILAGYFEQFGPELSSDRVMEFAKRHLPLGEKADVERIDREEFLGKRV